MESAEGVVAVTTAGKRPEQIAVEMVPDPRLGEDGETWHVYLEDPISDTGDSPGDYVPLEPQVGAGAEDVARELSNDARGIIARLVERIRLERADLERVAAYSALTAAWEELYRARDAYHKRPFSEEWHRYETALAAVVKAGGPDLRADEEQEILAERVPARRKLDTQAGCSPDVRAQGAEGEVGIGGTAPPTDAPAPPSAPAERVAAAPGAAEGDELNAKRGRT